MTNRVLRIGIDARPLRWPGIGRYVRELVAEIAEIDTEDRFFIYCDSTEAAEHFRGRWPNVQVAVVPSPLYSLSEQLRLPLRILLDRLDVFHAPSSLIIPLLHPCRLVVTVHDLLLKLHPEHLPSRLAGVYFSVMNAAALRSASQLLAVSEFTRKQLAAAYPCYAGKTRTVHNGVGSIFRPAQDPARLGEIRRSFGLANKYFLYVGTYKKHKNLPLLIKGFGGLSPELLAQCQLVLLARPDRRFPEADALIARFHLERLVVRVGRVQEDELVALYSGAQAVVMPSVYEGFGLPALEAMACGTAVVATRIPAFVEVAGDAALYVEPDDCDGMTATLTRLLQEPALRSRLVAAGLKRCASFTWRRTAMQTLDAYRSAFVGK
jgi:glycosyltransferase involved in cell wall biosynthesis